MWWTAMKGLFTLTKTLLDVLDEFMGWHSQNHHCSCCIKKDSQMNEVSSKPRILFEAERVPGLSGCAFHHIVPLCATVILVFSTFNKANCCQNVN